MPGIRTTLPLWTISPRGGPKSPKRFDKPCILDRAHVSFFSYPRPPVTVNRTMSSRLIAVRHWWTSPPRSHFGSHFSRSPHGTRFVRFHPLPIPWAIPVAVSGSIKIKCCLLFDRYFVATFFVPLWAEYYLWYFSLQNFFFPPPSSNRSLSSGS